MLNAYWEALTFELPPTPASNHRGWRRAVDTALTPPDDFTPWDVAPRVTTATYVVQPRSIALLIRALEQRQPAAPRRP
jgi:pullulanase/glycogen debranching enzyme